MATSGSVNFTRTAGQIIAIALRKAGLLAEGEVASADQSTDALEDLNLMVKAWPAKGINLWREEELVVYTVVDKQSYLIGSTGDESAFTNLKTELASDASSGASTITVDSDDDITNGDVIGVELDSGAIQWTTVNGVPSSDVVTLTATLTGDAGTDNHVYNYTTIASRPLRLDNGRLKINDSSEIPMVQISRNSYMNLPTKTSSGSATQYYYDPQLDNGKLFIWPTISTVKNRLFFTAHRQIEDLDATTNNLDFPQEWLRAIAWNLAVDIAFDYSVQRDNAPLYEKLEARAALYLEEVENFDIENVSVNFMPSDEDVEGWE